jgi:hypothetical protein
MPAGERACFPWAQPRKPLPAAYIGCSLSRIQMPMAETKLLFVDDDDALRTALGAVLTHRGFLLTSVSNVPEALERRNLTFYYRI